MIHLRVGILGAGYMGRLHAGNLAGCSGVTVAAVCSAEGAEDLAATLPGAKAYADFGRMLGEAGLDAVYVCLPPFAHEGQVEAAAAKGVHIFIEKPVALTVDRARRMAESIQKAGVVAQVGYHMRFGLAVQRLKDMIESGAAGRPTLLDARYDCNSLHSPWWREKSKCGGQVFEQIIHLYDLALHFLGEPETVTGFAANLCHRDVPGYTVEDTSAAAVRFRNGSLANISGSNCAVPMAWNSTFTVVCQNVTAHFVDPNRAEFILTGGAEPVRETVAGERDLYRAETEAFLAAVRGEGPRVAPFVEGLTGLCLVDAVLASAEKDGSPVRL